MDTSSRVAARPMNLQKVGGVAALIEAATYLIGFALFFTVIESAGYGAKGADPLKSVLFLANNQLTMYLWNLVIYVINSVFLVILALALHERLKDGAPALAQTATAFGLIWAGLVLASGMVANIGLGAVIDLHGRDPAQAVTLWRAMTAVEEGLGGGNEIAGGLWVLLISWAALRAHQLPKALNGLGVVIGVSGLLTIVPALAVLGAVFGLGFIAWFVWLGIVMLRVPVR